MAVKTMATHIASLCDALRRDGAQAQGHEAMLAWLQDYLPSGSGLDTGTTIDRSGTYDNRIVLHTSYHHMDGSGMYDGWTDHTIRAYASFVYGIRITVSGPDRNGIKDYLAELYQDALTRDIADMDYRDAAQKCYAND